MKSLNNLSRFFLLLIAFGGHAVFAQGTGKCNAVADQIYYVDSGRTVTDVYPGSNGGNGYQLNILGTGADQFEVVQERYMATVGVIPNYTNATQAKWGMTFAPNMAHVISTVRLKNRCTGETGEYKLVSAVNLAALEPGSCSAVANQVYFVDSGKSVTEVHPGPNGGNGYQLNILGSGADNFEVVQATFMATVGLIPNYTNSTQAKWGMTFRPKMSQVISAVRMKNKCNGSVADYPLTTAVRLLGR